MRNPIVIAITAVTVVLIAGLVAAFIVLLSKLGISRYWPIFVIIGIGGIALIPWRFRIALRRWIQKRLDERGGDATVTFSPSGIDTQSAHTAANFDWHVVGAAHTTPKGLILRIGRTNTYISRSNFASAADYARVLALLREQLGDKANLSEAIG